MNKKLLISVSLIVMSALLYSQDIFQKNGYNKEMLTLSKGKYKETFFNEEIMQIGTVLYNAKTKEVVEFLEEDISDTAYRAEYTSRWLSRDPLAEKYYWNSPYVYCNNNPVKYIDPDGRDGIATIDKDKRTINISQVFYYDASNPAFASQAITSDRTISNSALGTVTFTAETSLVKENGFDAQTWTVLDSDGNNWSVSFNTQFVGLENEEAVNNAMNSDPTSNKLVYDGNMQSAGVWNPNDRTLSIGVGRRMGEGDEGSTAIHEQGHSLGLPHENLMPNSPIYGGDIYSGSGIISYGTKRSIQNYEVQYGVNRILQTAVKSKSSQIKIHVAGSPTNTRPNKIIK
jgi:hypothetical protein